MTETRRVPLRQSEIYKDSDEPIIDLAKRIAATQGISLRAALRDIRSERKKRAEEAALAEAPAAKKDEAGVYQRVCADPRWPFGVEDGQVIAPHGFTANRLPKTTAAETKNMTPSQKKEAREIIEAKLKRLGCDPITIMAELAMSTTVKDEVRLRAAAELSSMIYPRLKGVENVTREENTVFVIGVPTERPETGDDWLAGAEGPKRIMAPDAIEGEATEVKTDEPA